MHRRRIHITLNEEIIFSFWVDGTTDDGVTLGPEIRGVDVHHTFWEKDGKIRYHIRHKGIEEPSDESHVGGQKSTKLVTDKMLKMLEKRLRHYHGNKTCWVFTLERWEKIKALSPRVNEKGDLVVPLEMTLAQLDIDFSKKDLWRKARIRELFNVAPHFGFTETRAGLRFVVPISKNEMLVWPLSKVDEIDKYLMEVLGFDEFANYLNDVEEGKKLFEIIDNRINQLLNQ
jgi:hypothetical protein